MENHYMQVVELTDERQIKLYLKSCTKLKLAEMLTEANKHLKNLSRVELPVSHRERHIELHKMFDELLADFIRHNPNKGLRTPIEYLMAWTYEQTKNPTE